jgi:hypothetical protein
MTQGIRPVEELPAVDLAKLIQGTGPAPSPPASSSSFSSSRYQRPTSTSSTVGPKPTAAPPSGGLVEPIQLVPGGAKGHGVTTRYYDCCKPSCSWNGKGPLTQPVRAVDKTGTAVQPVDARSGCDGGPSFYDSRQVAFPVNEDLAYGFVAASVQGQMDAPVCCKCYRLTFTNTAIAGKQMVVQVTNAGGLQKNHFDIAIPGGGMGDFTAGCTNQFGSFNGGARWGGVSSLEECALLPPMLRKGCEFRFTWFEGADNPEVDFEEVVCPKALTDLSGCSRF